MTVRESILETLRRTGRLMTAAEIAREGALVPSSVRRELPRMEHNDRTIEVNFWADSTSQGLRYQLRRDSHFCFTTSPISTYEPIDCENDQPLSSSN